MFRLLNIALLLATVSGGAVVTVDRSISPDGRIIGGESALIKTYPHQVSLMMWGSHFCGGSIISKNQVLTAGHCVHRRRPEQLSVRVGSSRLDCGGRIHAVSKIYLHEDFGYENFAPANDIAIVEVAEPFEFDDNCQPIDMFEADEAAHPGEMSVVTGWGMTEEDSLPDQLQTASIPIVSKELCNTAYKAKFGGLPKGQICAAYYGVGGKDACQGDSGGPLTIDGRLAGVVSWGNGCALPYYPGVYTEVAHYRRWVDKRLNHCVEAC